MVFLKVSVINGGEEVFNSPISSRPFGANKDKFTYEANPYKADLIYLNLHYLNCNEEFQHIRTLREYNDNADRCVSWSMHDRPEYAYLDKRSTKFICQPLHGPEINKEHKVIPAPLQMRHFEYELIKDKEFIESCRSQEKEYDFIFVGQTGYAGRDVFRPNNLKLDNYFFKETSPIYHVHNVQERVGILRDFCQQLAKAKYCFCPRGVGSSSFRLYQSLMVGTIPIVYGMQDFPFSEEVFWPNVAMIDCPLENLKDLQYSEQMRKEGIKVWENLFRIPQTDSLLFDKLVNND